jgi:hypothetical protein
LRKLLTVALATTATLGVAGASIAQAPAQGTLTATASPSTAGTAKKPKNVKLGIKTTVTTANASADKIIIKLPSQLKFSGKGFKKCNAEDLGAGGPTVCPSGAKAGPKGVANALVGPAASTTKAPLTLDVYPFVEDSNTFLFYLDDRGSEYVNVVKGEITGGGKTMTITLPVTVRQPVPGLDASLVSIQQTFSGKAKKNYIVSSTGCKGKKWNIGGTITFSQRADGFPPPGTLSNSASASCKKA